MYSQKQIERIALNIVENDDGFSDWLGDLINEHIADWVVENEIPIASIYDEEELVGFIVESSDGYLSSLETTEDDAGKVLGVDENGDPALLTISGGTKLYKHALHFSPNQAFQGDTDKHIIVINSSSEKLTTSTGVSNKVAIDTTFLNKIDANSNVVVVYPSSSLIIGFNTSNLTGQVILYYLQTSGGISITSSTNTYVSEFDSEEL